MKKYIAALLTALLLLCTALSAGAVGPALTTTEAYCIMDADTGLVLAQQNMNEELHTASITKVMTLGLACQKAQGNWDGVKLTVSHEDVYSLAGTDSSHIALREGEEVPLQDALYGTMIASANDGANLLAEYFGGGTIEGGVAAMNAQVAALGLEHTHFANPHGISGDDHYTSCYDMAQILRWALTQPGFETIFTRLEMYTMAPTNVQPVTRYFSQQDKMRLSYSRYYIPAIRGSKIGYTDLPSQGLTGEVEVVGGGGALGKVTVTDPGVRLLLADGVTAGDVSVSLELPERYVLGTSPEVYAVYTVNGGDKQESTSARVPAVLTGLDALLEANAGRELDTASDVKPARTAGMLIAISLACTAAAAGATLCVMRVMRLRKTKNRAKAAKGFSIQQNNKKR